MEEVSIIGVDLAKNVFQLHGAAADGAVVFRKKLSRLQFARFMADHPACDVAMEACPSAHHWAGEHSGHRCLSSTSGYVLDKVEGLAIAEDGTIWVSTDNDGVDDYSGETMFSPFTMQ